MITIKMVMKIGSSSTYLENKHGYTFVSILDSRERKYLCYFPILAPAKLLLSWSFCMFRQRCASVLGVDFFFLNLLMFSMLGFRSLGCKKYSINQPKKKVQFQMNIGTKSSCGESRFLSPIFYLSKTYFLFFSRGTQFVARLTY